MNDNDDGFYPEDQMDFPESQPQPVQNEAPKKKRGKKIKKKKEHDIDITGEVIKFFRRFWATRQTEDIDKANEPDKYVRITLRELFIYIVFLVVVSICKFNLVSLTFIAISLTFYLKCRLVWFHQLCFNINKFYMASLLIRPQAFIKLMTYGQ